MLRKILLLVVLVAVVQCSSSSSKNSTVQWGYRQYNDALLHRQFVRKSSSFMQKTIVEMQYPNGTYPINQRYITYIVAQDQKLNGKNGNVTMTSGGIGFFNVGLRFKSQRGEGLDFIVEIYGR